MCCVAFHHTNLHTGMPAKPEYSNLPHAGHSGVHTTSGTCGTRVYWRLQTTRSSNLSPQQSMTEYLFGRSAQKTLLPKTQRSICLLILPPRLLSCCCRRCCHLCSSRLPLALHIFAVHTRLLPRAKSNARLRFFARARLAPLIGPLAALVTCASRRVSPVDVRSNVTSTHASQLASAPSPLVHNLRQPLPSECLWRCCHRQRNPHKWCRRHVRHTHKSNLPVRWKVAQRRAANQGTIISLFLGQIWHSVTERCECEKPFDGVKFPSEYPPLLFCV